MRAVKDKALIRGNQLFFIARQLRVLCDKIATKRTQPRYGTLKMGNQSTAKSVQGQVRKRQVAKQSVPASWPNGVTTQLDTNAKWVKVTGRHTTWLLGYRSHLNNRFRVLKTLFTQYMARGTRQNEKSPRNANKNNTQCLFALRYAIKNVQLASLSW